MPDERIVLLNASYQPIGSAPKLASHHADTPLHLAFSCYLFNADGLLLITKRAASKKVWPNVWTNSFCGHPAPSESFRDAIMRRGLHELGLAKIHSLKKVIGDYRYQTPPYNGIIENEFCPVFTATTHDEPRPNPDEVDDYRWIDYTTLQKEITANPDRYSYWFKEQLVLLAKSGKLLQSAL